MTSIHYKDYYIPHFSKLHVMTTVERTVFDSPPRRVEQKSINEWFEGLDAKPDANGVFVSPRGIYSFVGGDLGYKVVITFGRQWVVFRKWHPLD